MEQFTVEDHICTETVAPKRRILRSDGVLYVVMLILVFGIILTGNALSARWAVSRIAIQLTLYALLVGGGYVVYRYCLTSFRYSLTSRMFTVNRVVGKKITPDESIHLSDVVSIRTAEHGERLPKTRDLCPGGCGERLVLTIRSGGRQYAVAVRPSEAFMGKLIGQWKTERK